jgi:hypothetical protein
MVDWLCLDWALGETCDVQTDNCVDSWCDESAGDAAGLGTCVAKLAGGSPCNADSECDSDSCVDDGDGGTVCTTNCKRP